MGNTMKRELTLKINDQDVTVTATREGQAITVERGEERYTVEVVAETIVGAPAIAPPAAAPARPSAGGAPAGRAPAGKAPASPAPAAQASGGGGAAGGPGAVPAPMTGVIDKVLVQDGAAVGEGDTVVVLEAMKMYIDVTAPVAGTVSGIAVSSGDSVKEGQTLLTIG
jgi:glutaconyl-CoA/methylmalonyl-CoA decarboxylase subunit gamma